MLPEVMERAMQPLIGIGRRRKYMKKLLKEIVQWGLAVGISMFMVSCLCFFYYRQTGWIERSGNATSAIWEPGTVLVNMIEGAGIVTVDENGYTNPPGMVLSDELVLCMGASYVQAKEVMASERYTTLLNDMLSKDGTLKVYNLSRDAMYFVEMVQGVEAAVKEFPQTRVLVLDTGNLDFSVEQLENALNQRTYNEAQTGNNIMSSISRMSKIKNFVKGNFPILGVIKHQLSLISENETLNSEEELVDDAEYAVALGNVFVKLKDIFEGQIIVLYHPMVALEESGDMTIMYSEKMEIFEQCCEEYGIDFVNTGDDFQQDYRKNAHVPYGFYNTTMGSGHINKWGHRVIAQALYEEITGGVQ